MNASAPLLFAAVLLLSTAACLGGSEDASLGIFDACNYADVLWVSPTYDVTRNSVEEQVEHTAKNLFVARSMLGFDENGSDDVSLTLAAEKIDEVYPSLTRHLSYRKGQMPALSLFCSPLVAGDALDVVVLHRGGEKHRASANSSRRVTLASLEGYDSIVVSATDPQEVFGTSHSPHSCNETHCSMPMGIEARLIAAASNAIADLRSAYPGLDYALLGCVMSVYVRREEYRHFREHFTADYLRELVGVFPLELRAKQTTVYVEPTDCVYGDHLGQAQLEGRSVELGSELHLQLKFSRCSPGWNC